MEPLNSPQDGETLTSPQHCQNMLEGPTPHFTAESRQFSCRAIDTAPTITTAKMICLTA